MTRTALLIARAKDVERRDTLKTSTADLDPAATVALMRATVPVDGSPEALQAAENAASSLRGVANRWRPQRFHAGQAAAFYSSARFRAMECGRRSGKSEGRKREIVIRALDPAWQLDDRFIVVGAPTQLQTMKLYWRDLLRLIPKPMIAAARKSEYEIETTTGTLIRVLGMDKPERAEGDPIDDLFLDEFADLRPDVLDHLRPSLDTPDRPPGTLTAFGTPDMRSGEAFILLCDQWRAEAEKGNADYSYHHWSAQGIVSEEQWEEARMRWDSAQFAVEYEARRVSTGNRAYYTFDRETHFARDLRLLTDKPLIVCLDFNVDPGVAVFAQEQSVDHYSTAARLPGQVADDFTAILGEVFIRRSNTPAVVKSVIAWLEQRQHTGPVHVYGDPAGGAGGSAKVEGSDVDLIRRRLSPVLGERLSMRFRSKAPAVVARLNAMNARLLAADGFVRMVVDPDACPETVKDLEQVHLKAGAHHVEIDKPTKGPAALRTHLSDALGYYVAAAHPARVHTDLVDVGI